MTLECVAYADLAGWISLGNNREDSADPGVLFAVKVGYVLLEVIGRAVFEFLAFSAVTFLWLETAKNDTSVHRPSWLSECSSAVILPRILFVTGGILCLVSIEEAIDMLTSSNKEALWLFRGHMLVESIAWGIQAVLAATCAWWTALRISRLSTLPQSDRWTTIQIVSKPLVPMVLCAICYSIRSIWLFCSFVTLPHTASHLANHRNSVAWWIGFCWMPTLLPSTMLLYSARKRDPTPDQQFQRQHENARLAHPLLPTPVPPMEAFISFRKFRENHDLFSPLSTTTTANPRAAGDEGEDDFQTAEEECRQLDYEEASGGDDRRSASADAKEGGVGGHNGLTLGLKLLKRDASSLVLTTTL